MSTTYVAENKETTSARVFSRAPGQVPQEKRLVRLDSLLREHEKAMARKMAAIAVQECDGGAVIYMHVNQMVSKTSVIMRDRETGALVGLPAVMGG